MAQFNFGETGLTIRSMKTFGVASVVTALLLLPVLAVLSAAAVVVVLAAIAVVYLAVAALRALFRHLGSEPCAADVVDRARVADGLPLYARYWDHSANAGERTREPEEALIADYDAEMWGAVNLSRNEGGAVATEQRTEMLQAYRRRHPAGANRSRRAVYDTSRPPRRRSS